MSLIMFCAYLVSCSSVSMFSDDVALFASAFLISNAALSSMGLDLCVCVIMVSRLWSDCSCSFCTSECVFVSFTLGGSTR